MIKKLITSFCQKKIPTIQEVKQNWSEKSAKYNTFDLCPQTFYYSLLSVTRIWEAKNILEVACGTGKVLPFAIHLKNPSTHYLATDLSPDMVKLAKTSVKNNYQKYQSSASFENWLQTQNLSFKVANAQQEIKSDNNEKFDRIICNCVLMLTQNAEKMLKSLHKSAEKGCLLGVSVWGKPAQNNLLMLIRDSILQAGLELPNERSNFHLYNKVQELAKKCGWEVILKWNQNALFPITQANEEKHKELFYFQLQKWSQQDQAKIKKKLMKNIESEITSKKGLNFSCQLLVLKKKD